MAGNKILTNGTVTASKETLLDLDIAGQDLELEKILQLLPERYAGKIEAIASEGQLSLTAKVRVLQVLPAPRVLKQVSTCMMAPCTTLRPRKDTSGRSAGILFERHPAQGGLPVPVCN